MDKTFFVQASFLAIIFFASFYNTLGFEGFHADLPLGAVLDLKKDLHSTMQGSLGPWYDAVVWQSEVEAALWADENVARKELFAADLFACEMLTAASRKVCSIGGAWELADRPNERFQDNEKAFLSNSSSEAYALFTKYSIKYVFASQRQGFYAYGWKEPSLEKFGDEKLFKKIYDANGVKIWKIKYSMLE